MKQKINILLAIITMIIGIALTVLSDFKVGNLQQILVIVFLVFATFHLLGFLFNKQKDDKENLFVSLFSYLVAGVFNFISTFNTMYLAVLLFSWVILISLVKFKKGDYYHDRKNNMWIAQIIILVLFILSGILLCINLNYSSNIQLLLIGIFFYIQGILNLIDPVYTILMEKKYESRK